MSKIKMIALDLDGTLLNNKREIPEENKRILNEASQKGILIALSSGRMTESIEPTGDLLGIDCAIIAYNGAMIRTKKSDGRKIIFHKPLQAKYCDMLIKYTLKNHFMLNLYYEDKLFSQDDKALKKYSDLYSSQNGATYNFVEDISIFKEKDATKLILISDPSSGSNYDTRSRDGQYDYFNKKIGKEVNVTKTNPEYLEFMNKEVDKGIGIKKLAEHYSINISEVIAFGDGDNDAPMLAESGIGVAMKNAGQESKKAAKIVSEWTNEEAGVAKILKKYLD